MMANHILSIIYMIVIIMILSLISLGWNIYVVGRELNRAQGAGEVPRFSSSGKGGIPTTVLFTAGFLPRVEKERRRAVWSLIAFLGGMALLPTLKILEASN